MWEPARFKVHRLAWGCSPPPEGPRGQQGPAKDTHRTPSPAAGVPAPWLLQELRAGIEPGSLHVPGRKESQGKRVGKCLPCTVHPDWAAGLEGEVSRAGHREGSGRTSGPGRWQYIGGHTVSTVWRGTGSGVLG